jgi:predicted nucleotidyltransferase
MSEQTNLQWDMNSIIRFLREHREILRSMGVIKIGLFGSYARNEQKADSDMDFLVEMRDASYRNFMNVWHFLEDHFQHPIDLGEEAYLRDEIRTRILNEVKYVQTL